MELPESIGYTNIQLFIMQKLVRHDFFVVSPGMLPYIANLTVKNVCFAIPGILFYTCK